MGAPSSTRAVVAALVGNTAIAVGKLIAAYFSGSAAMMAESWHSLADSGNQVLLLVGMRLSKKGVSEKFVFGRASEAYFWPFLVSVLLFLVGGIFALYEGIQRLRHPHLHASGAGLYWSYGVLIVAIAIECVSWAIAYREFRLSQGKRTILETMKQSKDPTLTVVMLEDTAALLGLVLALLGLAASQLFGWYGYDALASCVIGILLCGVAYFLARKTHSLLIGESLSPEDQAQVYALASKEDGVKHITQLLSMHLGPTEALAALKLRFAANTSLQQAEEIINRIENNVRDAMPHIRYIFIEPDSRYDRSLDQERRSIS